MGFAPHMLERLRTTEEIRIETRRAPDAPAHRTIIWVVVDDADRVLVRSVRGSQGRWYREALGHPECTVWIGPDAIEVRAEPAGDPVRIASASAALSAKYAGASLRAMLAPRVLETTLELLPR